MIQKYKHEIILAALLISFSFAFYYLYGILFPFILGLLLAFSANPIIIRIKKIVRNRNLATTIFLTVIAGIIFLFFTFLTQYINRDFKRLSKSFTVLASNNKDNLDKAGQKAKEYLGSFYDFDQLESKLKLQSDSVKYDLQKIDTSKLDTESIKGSLEEIISIFQSEDGSDSEKKTGFSIVFMLFSTILYFILILYQFDYFAEIRRKYFSKKISSKFNIIVDDFNQSFVKYFKLRTKIVLLLSLFYITAFIIIDMPGLIIITIVIVLLSYIPYLQYIALIPISIGCLVLSVENNQSFLLFFGIIAGVFIVASIIEELILNPWIMEKNIGMNPVVMILALSVWSYLFGLQGLLIGIPMTSILFIYLKRYFLTSYQEVLQDGFTNRHTKDER